MSRVTGLIQSALAALVTVLLLASSNLDLSDLEMPILIAFFVAVIAWLIAGLATPSSARRGIIGVALTFGFLLYGYYADPVEQSLPVGAIAAKLVTLGLFLYGYYADPVEQYLPVEAIVAKLVTLGLFLFVWLAAARWFGRRERDLSEFSRGLSAALVAMAVLVSMPVLREFGGASRPVAVLQDTRGTMASDSIVVRDLPDIFLIVLDA